MTLRQGNRMRRTSGEQVIRELQAAEACEQSGDSEPTKGEIERRAYEIYLARNGAPGNAELDWMQAEIALRANKAAAAESDRGSSGQPSKEHREQSHDFACIKSGSTIA